MLPEVKKLCEKYDKLIDQYNKGIITYSKFIIELKLGFDELAKSTDDKLVKWIASNPEIREEYYHQGLAILKELPASFERLNEVASRHGWCSVWNRLRDSAIARGLIEVKYEIRISVNHGTWRPFDAIPLENEKKISRERITSMFRLGVTAVTIEVNGTVLRYQKHPISP